MDLLKEQTLLFRNSLCYASFEYRINDAAVPVCAVRGNQACLPEPSRPLGGGGLPKYVFHENPMTEVKYLIGFVTLLILFCVNSISCVFLKCGGRN